MGANFPTHHGQIELLLDLLDVIAKGALDVMLAQLILQHPSLPIGSIAIQVLLLLLKQSYRWSVSRRGHADQAKLFQEFQQADNAVRAAPA